MLFKARCARATPTQQSQQLHNKQAQCEISSPTHHRARALATEGRGAAEAVRRGLLAERRWLLFTNNTLHEKPNRRGHETRTERGEQVFDDACATEQDCCIRTNKQGRGCWSLCAPPITPTIIKNSRRTLHQRVVLLSAHNPELQ